MNFDGVVLLCIRYGVFGICCMVLYVVFWYLFLINNSFIEKFLRTRGRYECIFDSLNRIWRGKTGEIGEAINALPRIHRHPTKKGPKRTLQSIRFSVSSPSEVHAHAHAYPPAHADASAR